MQLVDPCFLTPAECDHVFQRMLHHQDSWFCVTETCLETPAGVDPGRHRANFFGPSVYSMHSNLSGYQTAKTKYNPILFNEFGNIYTRINDAIDRTLGINTQYCDGAALPGFHIFGPGLESAPVCYDYFPMHQDFFPGMAHNIIPRGEIFSFIIPIKLPQSGANLLHRNGVYEYTTGSLSYWPGTVPHKIGDFVLDGVTDYRITWQMHVSVSNNRGTIFW